jgi:hypothetical protein
MKSIADVVEASGLAGYAEVALLLFFLVFVVVGIRALASDRAFLDHASHLPLEDAQVVPVVPSHPSSARDSGRGD